MNWRRLNGQKIEAPLLEAVEETIAREIAEGYKLKVCIGTDSQVVGDEVHFATVIVFLREKRGGFMSMRSAFLELGSGVAAVVCGLVVSITPQGKVENFNHVGYISILSGIVCIFIALRIKIVSNK